MINFGTETSLNPCLQAPEGVASDEKWRYMERLFHLFE